MDADGTQYLTSEWCSTQAPGDAFDLACSDACSDSAPAMPRRPYDTSCLEVSCTKMKCAPPFALLNAKSAFLWHFLCIDDLRVSGVLVLTTIGEPQRLVRTKFRKFAMTVACLGALRVTLGVLSGLSVLLAPLVGEPFWELDSNYQTRA